MINKIKFEVMGDIWSISKQVIGLCQQAGCSGEFVFNGTTVHVSPRSNIESVCERTLEAVQNRTLELWC